MRKLTLNLSSDESNSSKSWTAPTRNSLQKFLSREKWKKVRFGDVVQASWGGCRRSVRVLGVVSEWFCCAEGSTSLLAATDSGACVGTQELLLL